MRRIASALVAPTGPNDTQTIGTGGFTLLSDEPHAAGGRNAGPGPFNLLLASLGACMAITLKMYADRKGWDIGTLKIALTPSPAGASITTRRAEAA